MQIAAVASFSLALAGCSEFLDSQSPMDIEADKVVFNFPAIVAQNHIYSESETPNKFTASKGLTIADIGDEDVIKHAEAITGISIQRSSVGVTTKEGSKGHLIDHLIIVADDIPGSPQTIAPFRVGHDHFDNDEEKAFIAALVQKIVENGGKPVTVTIEGYTDAPERTLIDIKLKSDIVFFADPLIEKSSKNR